MTAKSIFAGRLSPSPPRFSLLGPVRAWAGNTELDLGSPQQRALLGVLLLRRDEPVSCEQATRALWGETAPRRADGTVRTYICRLRRVLGEAAGPDRLEIRSCAGGYLLTADGATVDTDLFREQLALARRARARGELEAALGHFQDGLALWRGTPFAEAHTAYFLSEREQWLRSRAVAVEELAAVQVLLGHHAEALAALEPALAAEPLCERLWELRMQALAGLGRRADALAVYQEVRQLLCAELGLEPGPGLRELHRALLAQDPEPAPVASAPAPAWPAPAELPDPPDGFVGRAAELAEIGDRLSDGRSPAVVALAGPAGVGKSALALRAAHDLRARFPDGRLYAALTGPDGRAVALRTVLAELLRAAGVTDARLTGSLPELTMLWRRLTDGRRLLLVLDDVPDGAEVLPLLPRSPGSAALLTGRRPPAGVPGAHTVVLDGLTLPDALHLLGAAVGHERLRRDAVAAARLAESCAYRPLALRGAAARLLATPRLGVAEAGRGLGTGAAVQPAEVWPAREAGLMSVQ
ncbi:BTAD domain-containing putative transcriptional regulator [Streptomyces sp. NPDC052396]|uniref:AfsR/SARP family transcriptional regulator n=1 Tax=Streptomyces sp. NPDC052396 TaxID=3365689 RepID=UPI0037D74B9C